MPHKQETKIFELFPVKEDIDIQETSKFCLTTISREVFYILVRAFSKQQMCTLGSSYE